MRDRPFPIYLMCLGCLIALPGRSWGHGFAIECHLRGKRLHVRARFDDGTVATAAHAELRDRAGNLVSEGRTDEKGQWSCEIPGPGPYRVVVDAGDGHRASKKVIWPRESTAGAASTRSGPTATIAGSEHRWLKLTIGIAVIGAVFFGLWLARWYQRPANGGKRLSGEPPQPG